jgi:uncharacterized protein GlcG (DUF336 family)
MDSDPRSPIPGYRNRAPDISGEGMLWGPGQARYSKLAFEHTIEDAAVQLREGRLAMLAMSFRLVLIGAAVSAVSPLAHAQLITHRDLSYAVVKTIAETAIDSCKANGYSVSAVVVDRAGEVIAALRGDDAGPHTMENARRKAYNARSFRTSTAAYAKRLASCAAIPNESEPSSQSLLFLQVFPG